MPTPKLPTPLTTTTTMTMIQVQLTGIRPCGGEAATGATGTMMDIIHPGPRRRRRHGHVAGGAGFGRAARLRLRHGTVRRVFKKEIACCWGGARRGIKDPGTRRLERSPVSIQRARRLVLSPISFIQWQGGSNTFRPPCQTPSLS